MEVCLRRVGLPLAPQRSECGGLAGLGLGRHLPLSSCAFVAHDVMLWEACRCRTLLW